MTTHKFTVGDRVEFVPSAFDANVRRGTYTVVRALPVAGRGCEYRVKHIQDEHERVIDEAQLRPAGGRSWPALS